MRQSDCLVNRTNIGQAARVRRRVEIRSVRSSREQPPGPFERNPVMPQPIPYLAFNGNCAEAARFYERVLGAKLEILMSGADSPMAAQIPKEFAHHILHA